MSRQVKSLYQTPKYTDAWEKCPQFKDWLTRGPLVRGSNSSTPVTTKAYCMLCEEVLEPTFMSLSDHAESVRHSLVSRFRHSRNSALVRNGVLADSIESRVVEYFKMKREFSIISSQVIDSMTGQPAANLEIKLYKHNQGHDEDWELVSRGHTDLDGYLDSLIFHTDILPVGIYKLEYMLQEYYFDKRKIKTTYPMVQPTFEIKDGMVQYHFRVSVAPHFHQVYLDTELACTNKTLTECVPTEPNMDEVIRVEVAVTA